MLELGMVLRHSACQRVMGGIAGFDGRGWGYNGFFLMIRKEGCGADMENVEEAFG
jgi:hypothetical protein